MKTTFTKKYISATRGCYTKVQVEELLKKFKSPIGLKTIIKDFPIPLRDKFWFLYRKCELELQQKVDLSYELAVIVSEIFNKEYLDDSRVNDCLQAIRDYKAGRIMIGELRAAAAAAADADAAAVAADAVAADAAAVAADADAAAVAADAAAVAADAAAVAADAVAAAADAVAAAADAAAAVVAADAAAVAADAVAAAADAAAAVVAADAVAAAADAAAAVVAADAADAAAEAAAEAALKQKLVDKTIEFLEL
jgi:hypothetical protein